VLYCCNVYYRAISVVIKKCWGSPNIFQIIYSTTLAASQKVFRMKILFYDAVILYSIAGRYSKSVFTNTRSLFRGNDIIIILCFNFRRIGYKVSRYKLKIHTWQRFQHIYYYLISCLKNTKRRNSFCCEK